MSDCEICPIVQAPQADNSKVLLLADRWRVALDRNQMYLGKSFVTLREHKETLADLDTTDWSELHEVIQWLESSIKRAFGATVLNWESLMNNAVLKGQSTHVHWHVYPRYLGGVTFAGKYFPDEKWPRHVEGGKRMVDDELFREIAGALKG